MDRAAWEIYAPTRFVFAAPAGLSGDIRYTLDGSAPSSSSPRAADPLELAETTTLRSTLFAGERALTAPATVVITRVVRPERDLVARLDFAAWDGRTGIVPLDSRCRSWVAAFAAAATLDGRRALVANPVITAEGPGGVDINMTRGAGRVPLKLHGLRLRDPEFTVGLWFRSDTGDGLLFGKQGLTAFGKSYRTVSVRVKDGRLRAEPGHLAGGTVQIGAWHHAVLSATPDRLALYLDGKLVDDSPGAPGLATDALDFFADHPGALAGVAIYSRELSAEDVARWHAAGIPSRKEESYE
jgi:hypothetical protein